MTASRSLAYSPQKLMEATNRTQWRKRCRRALLAVPVVLAAGAAVWWCLPRVGVAQWQLLRQVTDMEHADADASHVQMLGWSLAILGRDDEVRRMDFLPHLNRDTAPLKAEAQELSIVPWREGIERIARTHRIVMVMEDHFVSKHREMVEATLPIFRAAGFTHYAAEAIQEPGQSLTDRGYPAVATGLYTGDPRFGNLLRSALNLKFTMLGYDFGHSAHEAREEYAATALARVVNGQPGARLLVHAGHAHVLKRPTETGQRWLASILWEKTGLEPFTIWQWSDLHDAREYRALLPLLQQRLGDFAEPILLMPPPAGIPGGQIPDVDAILVHPPDHSTAPADRTVLFPGTMHQVSGHWITAKWPVIIAAYRHGEPATAIPLDQVMLRDREQDFTLWLPSGPDYYLAVFDERGRVKAIATPEPGTRQFSLQAAP
jgi:hypothetical protein